MEINNQTVVISGAASGMGAAVARRLSSLGAKVALLDRNGEAVQLLADELRGIAVTCDVTDAVQLESAIQTVTDAYGGIRIAIACAGIAPAHRIVSKRGPMALADFNQVIQVNLLGTFNLMRLAAASMIQTEAVNQDGERGVIINTASVAAFEGQIGQAAYSASKGGVVAMTLPAAREFAQFGVRVNAIAPGLIATPLLLNMPEAVQNSLAEQVPFPKRLGKPEEFASLVQHIIENPLLNGEVIRLDGGIRMAAG